jgi:hypothetical protein
MAKLAKVVGALLLLAGLAVSAGFGSGVVRDAEYARAKLLLERNPGNVLYEAKHGAAAVKRGFLIVGAVSGALLSLNGVTLLLLGVVAGRQTRP